MVISIVLAGTARPETLRAMTARNAAILLRQVVSSRLLVAGAQAQVTGDELQVASNKLLVPGDAL